MKVTFDVQAANFVMQELGGINSYEICGLCRHCHGYTIFLVRDVPNSNYEEFHHIGILNYGGVLNDYVKVENYLSLKDHAKVEPPEHVPDSIAKIFREGATNVAVQCYNAACAMYRLCIDLTTKSLLPPEGESNGPNSHQRSKLAARLDWLFDKNRLPASLRELSHCIREDGNDAAHDGSVDEDEAVDLQDFTIHLLENVYTTPERLALAKDRRTARRGQT